VMMVNRFLEIVREMATNYSETVLA
jgi:hypothetical protein